MKLTLQQLKVFATIARHGNLGGAANELCLSKGAVSQSLQELERQLATPLFDRVHPRLQLNGEEVAASGIGEYPDLYAAFADLIDRRTSSVDPEPLRLVADTLLVAKREMVEAVTV